MSCESFGLGPPSNYDSNVHYRRRSSAPDILRGNEETASIASTGKKIKRFPSQTSLSDAVTHATRNRRMQVKTVFLMSKLGAKIGKHTNANEALLLDLCETGDTEAAEKLLRDNDDLNANCKDILGRTPLQIALEKEDIQLMDILISFSNNNNIETTLLHAINENKESIACAILKHPRYVKRVLPALKRQGTARGLLAGDFYVSSNFYLDTEPLILAAQRHLYAVVKLLLIRGEKITHPHLYTCSCEKCENRYRMDQVRFAHRRLNAYKGLTSDCYITMAANDPFEEAFRLRLEVKELSDIEKHFKFDYLMLANQLSDYLVRLVNNIRGSEELNIILSKIDNPTTDKGFAPLARIKQGIVSQEKKFIGHASCQMKLTRLWYAKARFLQRASWIKRIGFLSVFVMTYPFLALVYNFVPNVKQLKILETPAVKFMASAFSFIMFLSSVFAWTISEDSGTEFPLNLTTHPGLKKLFIPLSENTFRIRSSDLDYFEIAIFVWVLGMIWKKVHELIRRGFTEHMALFTVYTALDTAMIMLYLTSISLQFTVITKVRKAMSYFSENGHFALDELQAWSDTAAEHYYWMSPDRYYWFSIDPTFISEMVFAIANVLSFSRVSYLLASNEYLGPLQISLGRMGYDILRFGVIFCMLFLAFMVGINNLLSYYNDNRRTLFETFDHSKNDDIPAGENFGRLLPTFRSMFFLTFGLSEYDTASLGVYSDGLTQHVAYVMIGAYVIANVLVMLNMLIAMMSRSFDQIEQDTDVEFKFARSMLYLEYIDHPNALPVPFNLLPSWRNLLSLFKFFLELFNIKYSGLEDEGLFSETRKYFDRSKQSKEIYQQIQKIAYEQIMEKVKQRFISDVTRSVEDDNDNNMDVVRQDILRLRRDLNLHADLPESGDVCDNKYSSPIQELKVKIEELEMSVNRLSNQQDDILALLKETVARRFTRELSRRISQAVDDHHVAECVRAERLSGDGDEAVSATLEEEDTDTEDLESRECTVS